MSKLIKWCLGVALFVFSGLLPVTGHAQAISYSALKYGTAQTSMASGYFVRPAQVVVKNHAYVVTMDIKTAKKLTSWPVKVLAVNGSAPENVRKTKDSAGNSHLYYSFVTTDLKRDINAKLYIYVPKVYKATHNISFKFKTAGLPALTATKTVKAAARHQSSVVKQASRTHIVRQTPEAKKQANESRQAAAKPSTTKARANAKNNSSSNKRSSQPQPTSSSSSKSVQVTRAADQVPMQKTHWGGLIGGAIAIVVLVGGGSWWYFGRH
ncbi:NEAT domain-containing protein [Levilactobacillus fujinensis]|uniref:NEAT domain-containing protein n=1 Tax=Levilactobacillus fujinensis TaxID=2486024 RepID=A0ABW1TIP4_9LACO|nr:NEAT domain-containing protein [Levilactobacillus fujinensis]